MGSALIDFLITLIEPEKNPLMYFYLLAAGGWFLVLVVAISKWLWMRSSH